jgi:hypothetical protein
MRLSVRVAPGVWLPTSSRRRSSSSSGQRARGSHFAAKEAQDKDVRKLAAEVYPKLATKLAGRTLYWLFIFTCSLVIVATFEPVVWTVVGSVVAFLCLCAVIAVHQANLESVGRQLMANRAAQQRAQAAARQATIEKHIDLKNKVLQARVSELAPTHCKHCGAVHDPTRGLCPYCAR